ncbi:hypothetical protein [Mitsuaria sp. 7]|uniref:hypothetical protein n=1 Tax=Mitsuaria sp. 7 TaxID=1658665 RepID=UPI0007DD0ED5|nr:hypothetical protein [Mitsuaria sp. 7]ANH68273.1 hypothetical protein ABE85_13150 [Mitsuaria sp. 7]
MSMHAPNARTTGLVLVGLVHLLMVGALVKGFQRHAVEAPPLIKMKTIVEPEDKPKPVEPPRIPEPAIQTPRMVEVPIPPVEITQTKEPVIVATGVTDGRTNTPFEVTEAGSKQDVTPNRAPPDTAIKTPGAVCTQMAAPEMPAVSWTGEALFRAVADVQGGRVVSVQLQALGGSMDARTRRAFSNAIEGTLKSRYVCPGDHRFQQDFAFRMD